MPVYRTKQDPVTGQVIIAPFGSHPRPIKPSFFSKDRKRPTRWTFLWWEIKYMVRSFFRGNGRHVLTWPKRKLKRIRYKRRYTPQVVVFRRVIA